MRGDEIRNLVAGARTGTFDAIDLRQTKGLLTVRPRLSTLQRMASDNAKRVVICVILN